MNGFLQVCVELAREGFELCVRRGIAGKLVFTLSYENAKGKVISESHAFETQTRVVHLLLEPVVLDWIYITAARLKEAS